ncbi:hypothetical protein FPV67DRAFT_1724001, partial [Lyophyllum atratum]
QCEFCKLTVRTAQGVNSHIFQTATCRTKFLCKYSGSANDTTDHAGGGQADIPLNIDEHPFPVHDDGPPHDLQHHPEVVEMQPRHRATVEDVIEDLDNVVNPDDRWVEDYPGSAGATYGHCENTFSTYRKKQENRGHAPWYPFESQKEWELAEWLMTSGVSQRKIDSFLKLKSIREDANPAFHNARSLLQRIDALPRSPEWMCTALQITGDEKDVAGNLRTEEVELWHRNPVECIQELLENPLIGGRNTYASCRVFRNEDCTNREHGEMNTGDWWPETQQEKLPPGATLVPVILSSDKTNLTNFSGDKQAYPPLIDAGKNGVRMNCADGFVRITYPIVAAYVADYPEQCLVVGCQENSCPKCTVKPKQRGDPVHSVLRDPEKTLRTLAEKARGEHPADFIRQSLRPINPFWKDLPFCNIFACITPDILHQLHKGVFKDHIVSWASAAVSGGAAEVDRRFRTMTQHPNLRHFKKGISLTSQWTGTEHKNMEKVFLGVLANATDAAVVRAVRGILDFIYYSHFEIHTDESLAHLDAAWVAFHDNKKIFEDLEIREHFNISKLHNIKHYLDSIRELGSAAGFNTEATERLHIDLAKVGYRATNKKAYTKQMTVWLRRREAVERFGSYLQWVMPGYKPTVATGVGDGGEVEGVGDEEDDDLNEEEENTWRPRDQTTAIRFAKKPALPHVTVQSIVQDFGAQAFLTHLESFLREHSITSPNPLSERSTFPVYRRLELSLPAIPEISRTAIKDSVVATKAERGTVTINGIKKAKPARFSTALVRVRPADRSKAPIDGLQIVQIRLIFRLPGGHGSFDEPLLYVHWFKPLRTFEKNLGMYQTSFSSQNHRQRASIIKASQLFSSCHLIPCFGRAANPAWGSESVINDAPSFYLNPYLRHFDFYHLRYLPDLQLYRNRPRREVARRQHLALVHNARHGRS